MMVSIVTISFNQAAFLEQAILSVLDQDYPDIEYIVVDPGSTDGSHDIIERYRDRIDKVIFEPDNGPADGLNKGFSLATGDVFGFLNSDDVLLPGALTSVVDAFSSHKGVSVISSHGYVIDVSGRVRRKIYSDKYSLLRDAYGQSILVQPSTFFLADAYKEVGGFNVRNRSNWDGELFYNMAKMSKKFVTVDGFWSCYRLYPESITGSALLDGQIRSYGERKFIELMGRSKRWFDVPIGKCLNIYKHLSSPRTLFERILKGGIYGQG